ncbi:MAG: lasso RiPP family leader peptide-containing protein [Dehalococcoidia bacterium]
MKKNYSTPLATKVGDIRALTQGAPWPGPGDGLLTHNPEPDPKPEVS